MRFVGFTSEPLFLDEGNMLHRMTEQEILIQKIKNLRMVSVYEFTNAVRKEGDDGTGPVTASGCTAVTVLYGDGSQITLSEVDPYFEELVERILTVYSETENRSAVLMDETTRSILEAGIAEVEEAYTDSYVKLQGSTLPTISFDAALSRMFVPIAEYLVTQLESILEKNGKIGKCYFGWRGRGALELRRERNVSEHPVSTVRLDKTNYRMVIGNYPEDGENMQVDIVLGPEEAEIAFAAERMNFTGRFRFLFRVNNMETQISILQNGKEICYENEKYESEGVEIGEREAKLLPEGVTPNVTYRLPFGVDYLLFEKQDAEGEILKKEYLRTLAFREAGYSETVSWTVVKNRTTGVIIRKENVRMVRAEIGGGRYQTYFDIAGAGASGRYRTALAGRYFIT
jgi:hypothetical protein